MDQSAPLFSKLSQPVFSLSTQGLPGGQRASLNLVTYASPIAIKPDRMFALGLYLGTLSHENFRHHKRGVLQLLQQQHVPLFELLGKTSARSTDKLAAIETAGFRLRERYGLATLEDAACVMELEAASDFTPCGDHEVVLCRVTRFENLAEGPERVLYTDTLRKAGLM